MRVIYALLLLGVLHEYAISDSDTASTHNQSNATDATNTTAANTTADTTASTTAPTSVTMTSTTPDQKTASISTTLSPATSNKTVTPGLNNSSESSVNVHANQSTTDPTVKTDPNSQSNGSQDSLANQTTTNPTITTVTPDSKNQSKGSNDTRVSSSDSNLSLTTTTPVTTSQESKATQSASTKHSNADITTTQVGIQVPTSTSKPNPTTQTTIQDSQSSTESRTTKTVNGPTLITPTIVTSGMTTSAVSPRTGPTIADGPFEYNFGKTGKLEDKRLHDMCQKLMKSMGGVTCHLEGNAKNGTMEFIRGSIQVKPEFLQKYFEEMQPNTDNTTLIAILAACGALLAMIIGLTIYAMCHRKSYRKDQQHLTEELQTVENGYHDNPTLEVTEVQSEMQEKKTTLIGEFNDSWIVPIDNLTKDDMPDEEDTHL